MWFNGCVNIGCCTRPLLVEVFGVKCLFSCLQWRLIGIHYQLGFIISINQRKSRDVYFHPKIKFSNLGYYAGEKPPPPVILTSPNKVKVPGELVLLKIISCHIFYNLNLVLTFVLLIIDQRSSQSFTVTYGISLCMICTVHVYHT